MKRIVVLLALLLAMPVFAQKDPEVELRALLSEFFQAQMAHHQKGGPHAALVTGQKYLEFEERNRGTKAGARALTLLYRSLPAEDAFQELRSSCELRFCEEYRNNAQMGPMLMNLAYNSKPASVLLLRSFAKQSDLASNRAWARAVEGRVLMELGRDQEARQSFLSLSADYGELEGPGGRTFREWAKGKIFTLDHLRVGQPAPELSATDMNGEELSLGQFRGKVVLLSFWGDW